MHSLRLPRLTWRNVGKAIFYAPAVLVGIPGVIVLPFVEPSVFFSAQLAMFLSFIVAVKLDVGFGRDGEAIGRHHGLRLVLDHVLLLGLVALAFTMALSAPERLFADCWWVLSVGMIFVYLTLALPWMRNWRAQRLAEAQDRAAEAEALAGQLEEPPRRERPSALAEEDS